MANAFLPPKPKAAKVVLLRAKELGNNCHYIADNYPGGMLICQAGEVPADTDVVVRWGTTTKTPKPEKMVINTADAIRGSTDKGGMRLAANKIGLTARTWGSLEDLQKEDDVGKVVVRPRHHSRSEKLFLCATYEELMAAVKVCGIEVDEKGYTGYYISDYVEKTQEFRVFVAGGRAFMVYNKKPKSKSEVSWGCVEQGSLEYVAWSEWPTFVVENAIKAFNLSKLDFGAVDVMVKDGKAFFLEINTAPEVWAYYGQRFADVISYIVNNGKARLEVKDWKNWKNLIHPAITEKAVL